MATTNKGSTQETLASDFSDPSARRAILVLDQHDLEKRSYEGDTSVFQERESLVVPLEEFKIRETNILMQNIWDAGLARSGLVLVQSPFELDVYESIDDAPQKFALAKYMYFSTLCLFLGARKVSVEHVEIRRDSDEIHLDVDGGFSFKGVKGKISGSVEQQKFQQFRSGLSLVDEFEGGEPDTEAAEKFLRSKHLITDSNMKTLLEMSRSTNNRIKKRRLVLNLSSESKHNLNIAGRLELELNVLPGGGSAGGSFDRKSTSTNEYILTVEVEF